MNRGPFVFLGLLVAMACSWLGFSFAPQVQLGGLQTTNTLVVSGMGQAYPNPQAGTAHQGAEIYRANGCDACHTQQIRPRLLGSDIERGWGIRRSVAYDYLFEQPVMLGNLRVGPDLANAGRRMDATTVLMHLYEPRSVTQDSFMPAFPYLFEKHKIAGARSPEALPLTGPYAPPEGYEIIPKAEARSLAAYIMSLNQKDYLFEAPPPPQPAGKTNAPAGMTNAVPTNSPAKR